MKKIISWNVNGIRSVANKGFLEWLSDEKPDVLCLQETKAQEHQLGPEITAPIGYQSYWHSAKKPGYSGVAIYTRHKPQDVWDGVGEKSIDDEGRVLTLKFDEFVLVNAYFPNSQREHTRLGYKLDFCKSIHQYLQKLEKKHGRVLICGDFNIAHREIDLKNPKTNVKNAGFLPEERAWMDYFLKNGFHDTFREFHKDEPDHYTWWSYRPGIRERNIGWRIDYFCANQAMFNAVEAAEIHSEIHGSDHCPVSVSVNFGKRSSKT